MCKDERGKGGNRRRNNVNYDVECDLCPQDHRPVYIGETSRNLYTRAKEHLGGEQREGTKENEPCFVRRHMEQHHQGEESRFRAKVTRTNNDSMTDQAGERRGDDKKIE